MKHTAFALLILSSAAWAQGVLVDDTERAVAGQFTIKALSVKASIDNQAATVTVEETIVNATGGDAEVRFFFPIPRGAAATKFELWIGEKKLDGELLPADKARDLFREAVTRKKDPALLEYLGGGLYRTSLFPLPRGEERKLRVTYVETLKRDSGLTRFAFPLSMLKHARDVGAVSVELGISAGMPLTTIYSPTHALVVTRDGPRKAKATWTGTRTASPSDLELFIGADDDDLGISLMTYRPDPKEPGTFLLAIAPKWEVDPKKVEPKDIVFVLDRSGSMQGDKKIQQARDALIFCLRALNEQDRFGIVTFSGDVTPFESGLCEYTAEMKEKAVRHVEGVKAQGSTNIKGALDAAFAMHGAAVEGRTKMILFLTDGLPTVGEQDPAKICAAARDANKGAVRVFAFGVGYDVNTTLLDKLMREHNGDSAYIKPEENLEAAISAYYTKIQSPVLGSLKLDFGEVKTKEMLPRALPDLFQGSQLVVTGRYEGHGATKITLTGSAQGRARTFRYDVHFEEKTVGDARAFVARLWATRRVGDLIDQAQLYGANKEIIDEIVKLSTRYGVITEYTAFLVDEKTDLKDATSNAKKCEDSLKGLKEHGQGGVNQSLNKKDAQMAQQQRANAWRNEKGEWVSAESGCKQVGARTFYQRNKVWQDVDVKGDEAAEEVAYFSDAFFKVLEERPDLCAVAALNVDVVVKSGDKVLKLRK